MDPGQLFSLWSSPQASAVSAASGPTVSFSATLCSFSVTGNFVKYRTVPTGDLDPMVRGAIHDGIVSVSFPLVAHTTAEPMDVIMVEGCAEAGSPDGRVFLNANTVRVVKCWRDVVQASTQHVLHPLSQSQKMGPPVVVYSGMPTEPAMSGNVAPGYHRLIEWDPTKLTWVSTRNHMEERRLTVNMTQRQWDTDSELRSNPKPIKMSMFIWEDQCAQLGISNDLAVWKSIMRCNPVPFYAMVAENKTFGKKNGDISLSTFAVQWDLSTYLTKHCVVLPLDMIRKLIKNTGGSSDQQIVNMSETGSAPTGSGWRYYAMTADPTNITTPKQVVETSCAKVFFALRTEVEKKPKIEGKKAKSPPRKQHKVSSEE
jgi:hypothetical protein